MGERMEMFKIVETDNFGRDYSNEKDVNLPPMTQIHTERVAIAINSGFPENHSRFWKVVDMGYVLQPGFEP